MNTTIKAAAKVAEELNQSNKNGDTKKEGIQYITAKLGKFLNKKWESKVMHGQYIRNMDRQLISEKDTFLLMSRGVPQEETECEIIAARDQGLQTKFTLQKYYKRKQIANADSVNNLM
jgi:hypothetical protein